MSKQQNYGVISLETKQQFEIIDVTAKVNDFIKKSGVNSGIALIYNPHTTAALRLNHNEPLLLGDIMKMLYKLIPADSNYSHDVFELRHSKDLNERSNGHAHLKAFLLGSSESLLIDGGKLVLGAKQSLFFVELDGGRTRDFYVKILAG